MRLLPPKFERWITLATGLITIQQIPPFVVYTDPLDSDSPGVDCVIQLLNDGEKDYHTKRNFSINVAHVIPLLLQTDREILLDR